MSNYIRFVRFNPREKKFLELYFSGWKMKDAARAAGYKARSSQGLCNRGRKILDKFSNNPQALFHQTGLRGLRIARLIGETLDSQSQPRQLVAMKILARFYLP
jgi:hypothetical protein